MPLRRKWGRLHDRRGCMTSLSGYPLVPVTAKLSLFSSRLLYRLLQTAHERESEYTRAFGKFFKTLSRIRKTDYLIDNASY